jgi:hypothetical protein
MSKNEEFIAVRTGTPEQASPQVTRTGHSTSLRRLFAFLKVNERYGDFTTVTS